METAGRAVLFSGLTVAIGLLGMLCLRLQNLASMGLAGTAVVLLAVLFSLTFLPALLSILGPRVDALRLPFLSPTQSERSRRAWRRLAAAVMAHPWRVLIPVVAVLVLVGSPSCASAWVPATPACSRAPRSRGAARNCAASSRQATPIRW
jgi:RND superfamily putative drug exporter